MPLPLSYPGLKCVLEHLEAVKRVHIIGRSPGFRKIDKLIPLRLKDLYFNRDDDFLTGTMTINTLTIDYDEDEVVFEMNGKTIFRKGLESREDRMKKLINYYISGKSIINVDWFDWRDSFVPESVDLKFRVNSLGAPYSCFNTVLPFIDPRSFPLKTLVTSIANTSTYDDQVVKSAETLNLTLLDNEIFTVESLKKLKNKRVVFERASYSRIDMVSLIEYHIETKKDIRTTFEISMSSTISINDMLREFDEAFGDFRCYLLNERFVPGSFRFSIPINNESRIQVYAIEDPDKDDRWKIVMKPVSAVYHFKHRY